MTKLKFGDVAWVTWADLAADTEGPVNEETGFTRQMEQADEMAQRICPNCEDEPWWGAMPLSEWWPGVEFAFCRGELVMARNKV